MLFVVRFYGIRTNIMTYPNLNTEPARAQAANAYLLQILAREAVDTGVFSPLRAVKAELDPLIRAWAGNKLTTVSPSGSFAKGTANKSGTDLDLFISLSPDTTETLKQLYDKLFARMSELGLAPKRQNVSVNIRFKGFDIDLVPAKQQQFLSADHSLFRRRADTWTKTNVQTHIAHVGASGRASEIRILKLWRSQKGLDFPSFYLELCVLRALSGAYGSLESKVMTVLLWLQSHFENARIMDPANTNNIISEDLTAAEKATIRAAAARAVTATNWNQIVT
jgi:hypothetical protein